MKQYNEALKACESVLQKDVNNIKALYRAGRVLAHLGEMERAVSQLQKALSLNPQDKTIQTELNRAVVKKERALQKEKEMCRRMMGTDISLSKSSPHKDSTWASAVLPLFTYITLYLLHRVLGHTWLWQVQLPPLPWGLPTFSPRNINEHQQISSIHINSVSIELQRLGICAWLAITSASLHVFSCLFGGRPTTH